MALNKFMEIVFFLAVIYKKYLKLYSFSFFRIWNLDGVQTSHFALNSPGMSVCWHPEESFKVIIYNLIFFYQGEKTYTCVILAHTEEKNQ